MQPSMKCQAEYLVGFKAYFKDREKLPNKNIQEITRTRQCFDQIWLSSKNMYKSKINGMKADASN